MLPNLGDFIDQLDRAGQLKRVACEVDAELEIAAITARIARDHGAALFFENVRGYRTPMVTNLLGTEERIRLALGVAKLDGALPPPTESQGGWLDKLRGKTPSAESHAPRLVRTGPCQQVVKLGRDVDLAEWPALRAWPAETLRSITAGILVLPESGMQSVAATILDRARLGVTAPIALDQRTPVAIVLGGEPALAVIASPTAQAFATSELAAHWRGRGPDVVACRTHDLLVPAEAEIVIEGFIEPAETMPAPPAAAESGRYATSGSMHVMEVMAVTHRTNPIFPAIVVSTPPCESSVVRGVVSRWLRATIEQVIPELVDYSLVTDAGPEQFAVVAIRKTYAGQGRKVLAACWGLEPLMRTKVLVVVGESVNVRDGWEVLRAVGACVDPLRDVIAWTGSKTGQLGIDATPKLAGEADQPSPEPLAVDSATAELVASRWQEYGL